MSAPNTQERYVMEKNNGELRRLGDQHAVLKSAMGTLVLAPVDFSKPGLRILDSGTADGIVPMYPAQCGALLLTDLVLN